MLSILSLQNSKLFNFFMKKEILLPIYHLSKEDFNGKMIKPRIPNNNFVKDGTEDGAIARICFCGDIGDCLSAISRNIDDGERFYVYQPIFSNRLQTVDNKSIVSKEYVPDAHLTGENWIISTVKFRLIAEIEVITCFPMMFDMVYRYGDSVDGDKNKFGMLRTWEWKFI